MSSLQQILNITDEEIKVAMSIMAGNVVSESVNEIISEETPTQKVGKTIIKKAMEGNFASRIAKKKAELEAAREATRAANKGKTTVDSISPSAKPAETPELKVLPTTKPSQSPVSDVFNDIKNSLPTTPQITLPKAVTMPKTVAQRAPNFKAPESKLVDGKPNSSMANDNPTNQNIIGNKSTKTDITNAPETGVSNPSKSIVNDTRIPLNYKKTDMVVGPAATLATGAAVLANKPNGKLQFTDFDKKSSGKGGIGSDSIAAPVKSQISNKDSDRPEVLSTYAKGPNKDSDKFDAPTLRPPGFKTLDFSNKDSDRPEVLSTYAKSPNKDSDKFDAPTLRPPGFKTPDFSNKDVTPKVSSKVSSKVTQATKQKEMSADELNTISLSLAKGNTPDVAAGTGDDREKKRNIADTIKNRMTTLTIRKEEIDLEQELKPNKPKYKWVEGSKVDKISNTNSPVKFGEPGNEPVDNLKNLKNKKEPLKLSNEEENIDINRIIDESRAEAIHTGKIKSSKRIVKALQKAADNEIEVSFDFDNGTQATIQPAIAKLALAHYNKLSPFEKAQAAKKMRESFKSFIQSTRGR